MYRPITYSLLIQNKACSKQLSLFKKHFGETEAIPLTNEVRNEFNKVKDAAYDSYKKDIKPAEDELKRLEDYLMSEMDKITKPAFEKCCQATSSLERARRLDNTELFFRLYNAE